MISNEQIAHDLAIAAVKDNWRTGELSFDGRDVVTDYEHWFKVFSDKLNS